MACAFATKVYQYSTGANGPKKCVCGTVEEDRIMSALRSTEYRDKVTGMTTCSIFPSIIRAFWNRYFFLPQHYVSSTLRQALFEIISAPTNSEVGLSYIGNGGGVKNYGRVKYLFYSCCALFKKLNRYLRRL